MNNGSIQVSSYRLLVYVGDDVRSQGTGWLVSADRVMTAFHVVGSDAVGAFLQHGLDNVRYVLQADGSEHLLGPLAFDAEADIAVLSLLKPAPGLERLGLASTDRQAHEAAWRGRGFPEFHNGRQFTLTGKVTDVNDRYSKEAMQLHVEQGTRVRWEGVSGTPLIEKDSATVIGLITSMTDDADTGWAATTAAIERLLLRYDNRQVELQKPGDARSLYRLWYEIVETNNTAAQSKPAFLLNELYKAWHDRDAELEIVVRWLLDYAWPDLLIVMVAALEETEYLQLLDEVKGRLIGARRLAVHLVWHHDWCHAKELAMVIYTALTRPADDPTAFGPGIPVFFWARPELDLLDPDLAQHSLVLVLIDDEMVVSDDWGEALRLLSGKIPVDDPRHLLVPCGFRKSAKNLDEEFGKRAFLDLSDFDEVLHEQILIIRVISQLVSLMENPDTGVVAKAEMFLSYAKRDGGPLVKTVQDSVMKYRLPGIEVLIDETHAIVGSPIDKFLDRIRNSVLVMFQTDAYSSRFWCKKEVLLAKQAGVPMLAVSALDEGESRTFPYLGNIRTIRYSAKGDEAEARWSLDVIRGALIELLYHRLFLSRSRKLVSAGLVDGGADGRVAEGVRVDSRPPELLTIASDESGRLPTCFLYPDPPLSTIEAEVFQRVAQQCVATTPAALIVDSFPRRTMRVALSISDPSSLARQGLDLKQLDDLWVAVTRHLLLAGSQLAFGLDLRTSGYGELMLRLLEQRIDTANYSQKAARSFIAWPLHLAPSNSGMSWADLKKVVRRKRVELPPLTLTVDREAFLPPNTTEDLYVWCRSLTHMRCELMGDVDALVAIGGKLTGYKGKYPGVVEEVKIALEKDLPVFLVGGFGGCCEAIMCALLEPTKSESMVRKLTLDYQAREKGRRELIEYYNTEIEREAQSGWRDELIDYEKLVDYFGSKGIRGLSNGLSIAENQRLFITTSADEIVWLILKGLSVLRERDAGGAT